MNVSLHNNFTLVLFKKFELYLSDAYLEPCETSMIEVNGWESSNVSHFLGSWHSTVLSWLTTSYTCREKQEGALSWEYWYSLVERNDMTLDTARASSVIWGKYLSWELKLRLAHSDLQSEWYAISLLMELM